MKNKPKINLTATITYRVGHDMSKDRPIIFDLCITDTGHILPTCWTVDHAEAMAYSLLKHVELVRRFQIGVQKTLTPGPEPAQPPAGWAGGALEAAHNGPGPGAQAT